MQQVRSPVTLSLLRGNDSVAMLVLPTCNDPWNRCIWKLALYECYQIAVSAVPHVQNVHAKEHLQCLSDFALQNP